MNFRIQPLVLFVLACAACSAGDARETRSSATPSITPKVSPTGTAVARLTPTSVQATPTLITPTFQAVSLLPITVESISRLEPLDRFEIPSDWGLTALRIDATSETLAAANFDGELAVWHLPGSAPSSQMQGGANVHKWNLGAQIDDVAFNPAGNQLAIASRSLGLSIHNSDTGDLLSRIPIDFRPTRIAYFDNGAKMAVAGHSLEHEGAILEIWDIDHRERLETLEDHPSFDFICSLAVSDDQAILAAGYCDYNMMSWGLSDGFDPIGRVLGLYAWKCEGGHCGAPRNIVQFAPDSHTLVSATDNWDIPFRDIHSGRLVIVISTVRMVSESAFSAWNPQDIAFSADGSIFVIAGANEIQFRDPSSGNFLHHSILGPDEHVSHIAFGSQNVLAIGKTSGEIEIWGIPG